MVRKVVHRKPPTKNLRIREDLLNMLMAVAMSKPTSAVDLLDEWLRPKVKAEFAKLAKKS